MDKKKSKKKERIERSESPATSLTEILSKDDEKIDENHEAEIFSSKENFDAFIGKLQKIAADKPQANFTRLNLGDFKIGKHGGRELKDAWRKLRADCFKFTNLSDEIQFVSKIYPKMLKNLDAKKIKSAADFPKRPASNFMLFSQKERKKLKEKFPKMSPTEMLALLGQKWKELKPQKRQKYDDKYQENLKKFHEEVEIFYAKHPDQKKPDKKSAKNHKISAPKSAIELFSAANRQTYSAIGFSGAKLKNKLLEKFALLSVDERRKWDDLAAKNLAEYLKNRKNDEEKVTPPKEPKKSAEKRPKPSISSASASSDDEKAEISPKKLSKVLPTSAETTKKAKKNDEKIIPPKAANKSAEKRPKPSSSSASASTDNEDDEIPPKKLSKILPTSPDTTKNPKNKEVERVSANSASPFLWPKTRDMSADWKLPSAALPKKPMPKILSGSGTDSSSDSESSESDDDQKKRKVNSSKTKISSRH